ncbi:hypothetical protein GEMRC1_012562 [Eukaryota sp. GEM-RC1]
MADITFTDFLSSVVCTLLDVDSGQFLSLVSSSSFSYLTCSFLDSPLTQKLFFIKTASSLEISSLLPQSSHPLPCAFFIKICYSSLPSSASLEFFHDKVLSGYFTPSESFFLLSSITKHLLPPILSSLEPFAPSHSSTLETDKKRDRDHSHLNSLLEASSSLSVSLASVLFVSCSVLDISFPPLPELLLTFGSTLDNSFIELLLVDQEVTETTTHTTRNSGKAFLEKSLKGFDGPLKSLMISIIQRCTSNWNLLCSLAGSGNQIASQTIPEFI